MRFLLSQEKPGTMDSCLRRSDEEKPDEQECAAWGMDSFQVDAVAAKPVGPPVRAVRGGTATEGGRAG